MALSFPQIPPNYVPVYNQSPYMIKENDGSGSLNDWRLQCQVRSLMLGGSEIGRFNLRFRLNDSGDKVAVFDPSEILKGLISYDHSEMPLNDTSPWQLCPNSIHWYEVYFESQKLISGVWVSQNNFTIRKKCVFNAALDVYTFASYVQGTYVTQQSQYPKPLTGLIPSTINPYRIGSNESYWIHFLSKDEQAPTAATIRTYPLPDLQGTVIDTLGYVNTFGLSFTGYPLIGGNQYTRPRVRVGVGTKDLQRISPAVSFTGVQSYSVEFASAPLGNFPETFVFNISDCNKYATTRVHWLNTQGGFDAWTFGMKSYEEEMSDRKQFIKQKNVLTDTSYGYDISSRGTTDYHIGLSSEITLNTDLLQDYELTFLRSLISSPVVFIEVGSTFKAVNVITKSWRQKRGVQDGTFNLELKIKPSLESVRQRG